MLELRNITKSYREQPVLRAVDFTVGEREMVSIMGKSGAGKSTLLAVAAGLVRPDGGRVLFRGQDLGNLDEEGLAAFRLHHIGFIFQDFKLIPALSAHDNILLGIYPRRDIALPEKTRRIGEFAAQVGLSHKLDEKVDNLSGGEKQRVAIARTLLKKPAMLIFDEATSALDSKTEQALQAELASLSRHHTTLVIAHRLSTIVQAHQILVMDHGRIIERGTHQDLLARGGVYAQMWNMQKKDDASVTPG